MATAAERALRVNVEQTNRGRGMAQAADDAERLSTEVGKTENKFDEFRKGQRNVQTEIDKSTAKLRDLRQQLAATGDTSLFGDIRKEQARLRNFENTAKSLQKDFEKLGGTAASGFLGTFFKALQAPEGIADAGPVGIAAIGGLVGGLATAFAAPVGAILAGAVVGTVGAGGVLGGVLAAAHDQRVKAAFGELGDQAKNEFFAAGAAFVQPTINSVHILETALHGLNLPQLLGPAANDVETIARGLAGLAGNAAPGLKNLFERSGPAAKEAAVGFERMGLALTALFNDVAGNRGSVEGINAIFGTVNNTIRFLGVNLKILSTAFHDFNFAGETVFTGLDHALGAIGVHIPFVHTLAQELQRVTGFSDQSQNVVGVLAGKVDQLGTSSAQTSRDVDELIKEIDDLNKLVEDLISNSLGVDEAQTNLRKSFLDLAQAFQENGSAFGTNTEKAIANEQAIQAVIESADRLRQAEIKSGDVSADVANNEFEQTIQQLIAMAKAAGISTDALEALAKRYVVDVEFASNVAAAGRAIAAQFQGALLNGGGLAAGGPALPGYSYTVGESEMERLDVLPGGGAVVTPLGGRSGGTSVAVTRVEFGGNVDSAFASAFMKLVRSGAITIQRKALVGA